LLAVLFHVLRSGATLMSAETLAGRVRRVRVPDAESGVTRSIYPVPRVERIAMFTVHTSPTAVLGGKDAGGLNVYVRDLAQQLDRCGVNIDIFTRRTDPSSPEITHLSGRVRLILVNAGPPEPMPKDDLFPLLPEFAAEAALFSLRDGVRYDAIHSHYWLSGWVAHLLKRYWNAPTVHTFHTLARLKNTAFGEAGAETSLRLNIEQRLLDLADNIIAPNPDERAEMVWRMGGNNARICVIPPGIDLDRFHPQDTLKARTHLDLPDGPLILFVGRIDPMKGIDTLLDGFAELRCRNSHASLAKLIFIGGNFEEGPFGRLPSAELQSVMDHAAALGVADAIFFRGAEPQEKLPAYYSAATVCAVPSRYESFGLVAVEAMACGVPVVASRAGGLKFTIEEEISGLLVPPSDPSALADALERVIVDRDLHASLRVGARQAAVRFSWQSIGPAMLNLYERLADGQRENLCCLGETYAS
jgi:D-inositol-3-phosphate glycosyltransferase